eukprot:gene16986-20215_t
MLRNGTEHAKLKNKLKDYAGLQAMSESGTIDPSKLHLLKQFNQLREAVDQVDSLPSALADYLEIAAMARKENDATMLSEASAIINNLYDTCEDLEMRTLMSQDNDTEDAFLEIHAGAGGTDSMDWAEILATMYRKWASRKGLIGRFQ